MEMIKHLKGLIDLQIKKTESKGTVYTLQFFVKLLSQCHFHKGSHITKQVVLRVLH